MSLFVPVFFSILGAACGLFVAALFSIVIYVLFLAVKGALTTDAE